MARKEKRFNSQIWFCICFLTYQVTCGVMLSDSRCSHQGTLHSSDQHIPVIRHQTNIKPHEHSYSLLRHSLMISYFMSADSISHLALALVVVSEADGCWLQLLPVWLLALDCSWCVVAVRVTSLRVSSGSASPGLTWCKRGHVGPRLHLSGQCGQGRHCVLSLLQHIVPAQASHHAGQASQSGEIAFSKYFAKRWGVHREGTNNSFEEERPSESIKCTLRRFSDPTKRLTTSQSTFSVQTKKFDLNFWQKDIWDINNTARIFPLLIMLLCYIIKSLT